MKKPQRACRLGPWGVLVRLQEHSPPPNSAILDEFRMRAALPAPASEGGC